jgi:hypothetical protein
MNAGRLSLTLACAVFLSCGNADDGKVQGEACYPEVGDPAMPECRNLEDHRKFLVGQTVSGSRVYSVDSGPTVKPSGPNEYYCCYSVTRERRE